MIEDIIIRLYHSLSIAFSHRRVVMSIPEKYYALHKLDWPIYGVYCTLLDASRAFDRVNYIKLFDILLDRNVCPLIIRFLLALYTSQMIRVKWDNEISNQYIVTNGVKQGGVLSPILFIMYIDELLVRLSMSKSGCHIGSMFCGALGYADDVVLLSPSITGVNELLRICSEFAIEYDVKFNSSKSKMLCFGNTLYEGDGVQFMGGLVEVVKADKHLGNNIGQNSNKCSIDSAINDLYYRTNMIMTHFAYVDFDVRYKLFKSYCMPLYGSVIWNYSGSNIQRFYTTWRKCIRRILGVPNTTHCNILHLICEDIDITSQLYNRCIKFIHSIVNGKNTISNMCLRLAVCGSRSNLSGTMSYLSQHLNISRYDICTSGAKCAKASSMSNQSLVDTSYVIRDMLHMVHYNDYSVLQKADVQFMLNELCTN